MRSPSRSTASHGCRGRSVQFYLDGYRPGDPLLEQPHPSVADRPDGLPDEVDVLIVGCGPAGLVLAAQLAQFPDITDRGHRPPGRPARGGPGRRGRLPHRGDVRGVRAGRPAASPRRYWVNEVAFWRPDPEDRDAHHADRPDPGRRGGPLGVPARHRQPGADARLPARLHGAVGQPAASRSTGCRPADVQVDRRRLGGAPRDRHPAPRGGRRRRPGETSTIRAKYVVGCDGARSGVRTAIGRELVGDPMNQSWGVMDVLAVTDFPDIRLKSAIHSANQGNLLIIPREGGYLVRLYIELDQVGDREMLDNRERHAREAGRGRQPDPAPVHARREETSAGGRSTRSASGCATSSTTCRPRRAGTRLPRVFIAGDACHTHSAKAGQGMNVSMADAWNLGWKLGAVLRGTARPGAAAHLLRRSGRRSRRSSSTSTASSPACSAPQPTASPDDERRRRPGGVPAVLRRPGPVHRRRRDPGTRRR